MISKKFTVYTRKQNIILGVLDVIQSIFGISILGVIMWAMFITQEEINIGSIIMGIAAIISLVDIVVRKTFNKDSFFHHLLLKLFKHDMALFPPTPVQKEVNSWINTRIQNGNGILIYGKPNIGKTSAIFMFLAKDTKDIKLLQNINWAKSILYIDCKNNKGDILEFFSTSRNDFNKELYENSLIIVDNLESMGKTFLENILNIVNSSLGKFILLSDVGSLDNNMYDTLERKCMRSNCTLSISEADLQSFNDIYNKLTDNEKKVLLVIYYISLSLTLIRVYDIHAILVRKIGFLRLNFIIFSLLQKGLIKYFPFDHTYILLARRVDMVKYHAVIWETHPNLEAVNEILANSEKFPESAWLSLVRLPYENINQIGREKREELFYFALKSGNYDNLYKELLEELTYSPIKENIFLYEAGTLYFYNSEQDKAFKKYNMLIEQEKSSYKQNRVMLKIIEATHGDVTYATQRNINIYLEKLANENYEYQLYAQYWRLHIETEKGYFPLQEYENLLKQLMICKNNIQEQEIFIEIVKRCYTDIIRSYHILKKSLPSIILSGFKMFLNENYKENIRMINYYNSLYMKANTLHYINLLNNILEYKSCQETYDCAVDEYNQAIVSGYENSKSVSACELKYIDLKLYLSDNISQFEKYETKIKTFLSNAEINRVSVHVAYCKTLLAKMYMIQNIYNNEFCKTFNRKKKSSTIRTYLREAKKIYNDYHNDYGVIRIDFIELLYSITSISDRNELRNIIKKMADILEKHQEYQREIDIIHFYENILNTNESFGMLATSILKAYPIIMQ